MEIVKIVEKALRDYTAYELAKVVGVSNQSLQKYKNGEAKIENMRVGTALEIVKYAEEMEKMNNIKELQEKYDKVKEQEKQGAVPAEEFIGIDEQIEIEEKLFKALTQELLDSMDEDVKVGDYDVYYQPNQKSVWLEGGWGMAYSGDDEDAFMVLQVEEGEIK